MNLSDIDLNLLLAFDAMMRTRSVSRAAARLGLRQPAMSGALARLRLLLRDELFVRAAGAMQPTPKALRMSPGIQEVLAQLRTIFDEGIPFIPAETARSFTIASTDYTTFVLGAALMADIGRAAPLLDLRIVGYDKGDIPDLIDRGDIDLALGVFQPPPERAVQQFLWPERFVGLARRGHPAFRGKAMPLDAYVAAEHALVSVRRDARGEIDQALAARGLSRRIALVLPHMLALPDILGASDLVAALPERVALRVAGPRLTVFELPLPVPKWRIAMLWNPAARTDAGGMWLRARVAAAARPGPRRADTKVG